MPANTSNWSNVQPSGSSSIRLGDDLIRSDKSILEAALNSEHYFDPVTVASIASGGIHKQGSARIFQGTRASLVTPSSADSAGRLHWSTDQGSLHYIAASSTSTIFGGTKSWGAKYGKGQASVTTATFSSLTFDQLSWDFGSYLSTTSQHYQIPAGAAGRYLLTANVGLSSLATQTFDLYIRKNSNMSIAYVSGWSTAGLNCSVIDNAVAGDFYDVVVQATNKITTSSQTNLVTFEIQYL